MSYKSSSVKYAAREGYTAVTPWIISRDTAGLLDFLGRAFGAEEVTRVPNPDGGIGHAEMRIGDAAVMLFDAPKGWPDTPSFLRLYVEDADALYARAIAAGAAPISDVTGLAFGDRVGRVPRPLRQYLVASSPRRGCERPRDGQARDGNEMDECHGLYADVAD